MFYCPYESIINDQYRQPLKNSFIRVMHASPNAPPVDIYENGNLIIQNLAFKDFSQYMSVIPGTYNIQVYPAGKKVKPIIDTSLIIPENTVFNVSVIGELPNISLYPIPEPTTAQNFGRACVRFVHLSPNAPAVDVTLSDGKKVFSNVNYTEFTQYACIPSGSYTFQVYPTGSKDIVLTVPNVQLMANNYYSIYLVGEVGGYEPLQAIAILEGTQ